MTTDERTSPRPRAVRLTFSFDAGGIRLIGRCPRQKPAPRGDDVKDEARPHAIALELASQAGTVLYRQTLVDPIPQTAEVVGPDGRLQRVPVARVRGAFTVVVPNLADAAEAVLWAGPQVDLRQPAFAVAAGARPARRILARVPFHGR